MHSFTDIHWMESQATLLEVRQWILQDQSQQTVTTTLLYTPDQAADILLRDHTRPPHYHIPTITIVAHLPILDHIIRENCDHKKHFFLTGWKEASLQLNYLTVVFHSLSEIQTMTIKYSVIFIEAVSFKARRLTSLWQNDFKQYHRNSSKFISKTPGMRLSQ